MNKIIIIITFLITGFQLYAQELRCGVTINTQQLKTTDPKVFKTLETAIYEFMNFTRWTDDVYKPEERIECELILTILNEEASGRFTAQATIISRRPVFGSDFNTTLVNTVDNDWEFQYVEFQPLEFNENVFLSNLTSMLAYYAYIIIGYDYDSYSLKGGDPYFQKAQTIVSQANNREEGGWRAIDGTRNRYWLITNLFDAKFSGFRSTMYQYHRLGLDNMAEDQIGPISTITKSIQTLDNINRTQPNSMVLQLFFSAKSDELQGIYSKAPPAEKAKAITMLQRLDPINVEKYQAILSGK